MAAIAAAAAGFAAGAWAWPKLAKRQDRAKRVLVAVSGTLQDGYPLRKNLDSPEGEAAFVGWALVRGVKLHLDPKPLGCREFVPPEGSGSPQGANPVAVCTGDEKDANIYAVYAVTESAALRALLNEPRMLGMTPDTVLVDLNEPETSPSLAIMLKRAAVEEFGQEADTSRAALLTVVAHKQPRGSVPVDPMHRKEDGTRVTSFTHGLEAFAGKPRSDRGHANALQFALRRAQGATNGLPEHPYACTPTTIRMNRPMRMEALRELAARAVPEGAWF